MITVQGLTRRFGARAAIEDLHFSLERGEVVGFLGPNGAGKSTTMRILAGYLPATSGSALVAGFDVLRQSLEVRRRIGYLPESVPLYAEHRVEEMMWFQARLHGMRRSEARTRIPAVLERAGIVDRSRAIIGGLSRGQRQRVGIAVALLPNPEVLILDEPTSGLDPLQRLEMRSLLAELGRDHTVLLSSHILPEIEAVCPRVIVLNRGKIAADGTKETLLGQLGGESRVRLEALVGPDVALALRLLKSIRGVGEIRDLGKQGIHHVFELPCREDLREDVGALAASRGWALRELTWQRPSLEQLFAKIALDMPHELPAAQPLASALAQAPTGSTAGEKLLVQLSPQPNAAPSVPAPPRTLYSLNPFDGGASRDLSKPKVVDPAPQPPREPGA
ncbi:MAG: ATP-binding cassette domain-containing protein [Planctomycetes bacterium]|nr:ATP-binding cassette domain-containing protein [Planctomycetota bacterium]